MASLNKLTKAKLIAKVNELTKHITCLQEENNGLREALRFKEQEFDEYMEDAVELSDLLFEGGEEDKLLLINDTVR